MAVLVGYASDHGSTREIAERIAARLADRGVAVAVRPVAEVGDMSGYDAAVIGSAIHGGDWLPQGAAFLERCQVELAGRPVWLYSVSSVGEESSAFPDAVSRRMRAMTKAPKAVGAVWDRVKPRAHHAFAGVIRPRDWGVRGRMFVAVFGGRYGDHRNWAEIDRWAAGIASELGARHPSA